MLMLILRGGKEFFPIGPLLNPKSVKDAVAKLKFRWRWSLSNEESERNMNIVYLWDGSRFCELLRKKKGEKWKRDEEGGLHILERERVKWGGRREVAYKWVKMGSITGTKDDSITQSWDLGWTRRKRQKFVKINWLSNKPKYDMFRKFWKFDPTF